MKWDVGKGTVAFFEVTMNDGWSRALTHFFQVRLNQKLKGLAFGRLVMSRLLWEPRQPRHCGRDLRFHH